jgi:hypothetical protein
MFLNETYSKFHIGKHFYDNFPIYNGLKKRDVLSPLLFNFALEYIIRRVKENQVGLKLNGTPRLFVYADYVNLLGDNIDTIKKNTKTLMLLSRNQIAGQNHDTKIGSRCFENVAQLRYLGATVTNKNLIQEEIKQKLNSGNACYFSIQNLLSSPLLSKNKNENTQNYTFTTSSVWV